MFGNFNMKKSKYKIDLYHDVQLPKEMRERGGTYIHAQTELRINRRKVKIVMYNKLILMKLSEIIHCLKVWLGH